MVNDTSHTRELDALSTVLLIAMFICAWVPAWSSVGNWVETLGEEEDRLRLTSATTVACFVTGVLFSSWLWLLLLLIILLAVDTFIIDVIRKQSRPKYGDLIHITFRALAKGPVAGSLVVSIVVTFLFAWIAMQRVLARHSRQTPSHVRKADYATVIRQSLVLNLGLVVVTLFVCGTASS